MQRILLSLFIILLCALQTRADDYSAWMSRIDDKVYVSQLSIPGAHDAGTGHGTSTDAFARTQNLTITEMWNKGIRAFDLRPAVDGEVLRIYHGVAGTNLTLNDALTSLCSLLDSHPTEMAVVVIRHETEADDGNADWKTMMTTLLSTAPVSKHTVAFKPLLTMSQGRGKMLVLSRDSYRSLPIGGYIYNWNSNPNFADQQGGQIKGSSSTAPCYIQDYYDCSMSGGPATKSRAVQAMLDFSSTQNTDPGIWAINHTSGYSKTLFSIPTRDGYRDNAATQNGALLDYLSTHGGSTGIVMMDCAGVDQSGSYNVKGGLLAAAIINNNFREGPNTAYFRALTSIEINVKRCITTEVNGTKYYLTTAGYLTDDAADASTFIFKKVEGGAYKYGYQFREICFARPPVAGNPVLNGGYLITDSKNKRNDWEAQVFMLGIDGKYAVRATNAAGGTEGMAVNAQTFWAVYSKDSQVAAGYAMEPQFIWQIEEPPVEVAVKDVRNVQGHIEIAKAYDLYGRRVDAQTRTHGLYIVGGRKVMQR
ncbi:MAG: hypothetical protein J6X27_00145 [Bacteroidaceae bacterium]|nr:hypothetical protein [Bacteroidaceae bacterium]